VQVGTDEGRSEGWTEGIPDAVGAWELVGAELGAPEAEGADEGKREGWIEGIPDTVGAWELVGAELGADELVGAEDFLLPFLLFPRFALLLFPLVGTVDGILEGVSEDRSDGINETEGAWETDGDKDGTLEIVGEEDVDGPTEGHTDPLEPPLPPFPPLPLNALSDKAPKALEKMSDSKMMVVPLVVFMMKKR
jgi:hypothetical protein